MSSYYRWAGHQWVHRVDGSTVRAGPRGDPITLTIRDPAGAHHTLPFYTNALLKYAMVQFSRRARLEARALRFCLDGRRLQEDDTPRKVRLGKGDVIEVYQQQTGGGAGDLRRGNS